MPQDKRVVLALQGSNSSASSRCLDSIASGIQCCIDGHMICFENCTAKVTYVYFCACAKPSSLARRKISCFGDFAVVHIGRGVLRSAGRGAQGRQEQSAVGPEQWITERSSPLGKRRSQEICRHSRLTLCWQHGKYAELRGN